MPRSNLVISLFDPQLDLIGNGKHKTVSQHSPILSIFGISNMPVEVSCLVLVEKHHLENCGDIPEAGERNDQRRENPVGTLADRIKKRLFDNIKHRVIAKEEQARLSARIQVELVPVEYRDIWNLDACNEAIESVFTKKMANGSKLKTVVLNLCGGTAPARTALYLATWRLLRSSLMNKSNPTKLDIVSYQRTGASANRFSYIHVDPRFPPNIGLLAQGVGTANPSYLETLGRLERIVLTTRNEKLLITGPTGSGKSELAKLVMAYMRALHSEVTEENCIHLNVAAISPSLIESELFGHEIGSFSGAREQHKGIFERADKGVVFLDEIGELPKELQAKLLTVLDGVPFTRVGGVEKIPSDFLLLCGTNVDLESACAKGDFRRDLFERLRTWTIEVPSLNDRTEDFNVALQRERGEWLTKTGVEVLFEKDALRLFMEKSRTHRWAGNFREFHATFVHLAMEADKGRITKDAVENEFRRMENICDNPLTISDTTNPTESAETEYDLAEVARLACALDTCRKCQTASEAGKMLFAARAKAAKDKGTLFNGASSLQRLFAQFGLKAVYKHGVCTIQPTRGKHKHWIS